MHRVLVLGAGKIGSLVATLLATSGHYEVVLTDRQQPQSLPPTDPGNLTFSLLDAQDNAQLDKIMGQTFQAVISCLPYYCNERVAEYAKKHQLHYFDLTEDVSVSRNIEKISQNASTAFVPQCGLAPGFISIVANNLINRFDAIDTVKMRVGALPTNPNNVLKYSLTWSTDGLINEYGNRCFGIENGDMTELLPLEGYETISIDGLLYEAFNTSGGLGTLAQTYAGRVRHMTYKTMRYPGHCEKIHFLMEDLKLNNDRDTLKRILENAVPKTKQDVVLIYVSVNGWQHGELYEENYVKKIYPQSIHQQPWSAIQVTTAAGVCAVVDIVLEETDQYQGFVRQEVIALDEFLVNRFGRYYS